MTLRPEYSLGHSQYNDFLFAAVGEEKTGLPLTVQTALIRLGFDPWQEAARLAGLSKAAAVLALTAAIARLPEGDWTVSALPEIAARLVSSLPGKVAPAVPPVQTRRFGLPFTLPALSLPVPNAVVWVAVAILLVGLLAVQSGNVFESASPNSPAPLYNK